MSQSISYSLLFSALLQLLLGTFAWSKRNEAAAKPLAVTFFIGAIWAFTYGMDIAARDVGTKIFWMLTRLTFNRFIPISTLWIAMEHLERSERFRKWAPTLLVVPILSIVFMWTGSYHQLYRYDYVVRQVGQLYILTWKTGPLYWISYFFDIVVYSSAIYQMLRSFSEVSRVKQRQTMLIMIGLFAPLVTDLTYNFGLSPIQGFNFTPYFMVLAEGLLVFSIFRYGWLRIAPVARNTLVDIMPSGMVTIDEHDRIVDINPYAEKVFNTSTQEIIGKDVRSALTFFGADIFLDPRSEHSKREVDITRPGNIVEYYEVENIPLHDHSGKFRGWLLYFNNITEHKQNELRLRQLEQAVEQSPASVAITDRNGNLVYVNPRFAEITGYTPKEIMGQNPRMIQSGQTPPEVYKEMWDTIKSGKPWRGELLNKSKNGSLYWELEVIAPVFEASGQIVNFIAIKEDITDRKLVEKELRDNRKFLADLIEYSGASIFVKDFEGRYQLVNHQWEVINGLKREDIIGRTDAELFPGTMGEEFRDHDFEVMRAGKVIEREEMLADPNGERYFITVKFPLRGADGTVSGVCGMSTEITAHKQLEKALQTANAQMKERLEEISTLQESLREQALRDSLTQLHNRRFLNETIEHEFHRAERLSQPLCIILLDIDHFKRVNDTYGHAAGDACLIALADLLKQNTRKSDIACRYGGEEFLLVLPNTPLEAAAQHAEKLRQVFAAASLTFDGSEIKSTISLGVAAYPLHGAKYNQIIGKADQALYFSKHTGRNRVTVWSDEIRS